ncbi:MAG: hypothetical protein FWF84_01195 [Kiritimatiellaeota bacterium]|nr:hypothetical protein [Kiritimatiellota bacterium]
MKRMTLCMVGMAMAVGGTALAQSVAHRLFSGERQLQAWADEVENCQPETLEEAWEVMEVLLRAERDEAFRQVMPKVYALLLKERVSGRDAPCVTRTPQEWQAYFEQRLNERDARLQQDQDIRLQQQWIALTLCRLPTERAKLSIAFFEMFDTAFYPGGDFGRLTQSMREMGWDDGQILAWMNARWQSALACEEDWEDMSFGYLGFLWPMPGMADGWHWLYFSLLRESPQWDEVFQKISDDARESPEDMKKLVIFLTSLHRRHGYYQSIPKKEMAWLLDTIETRSPLTAWIIAKNFESLAGKQDRENEAMREVLLKRALAEPLSAEALTLFRKIVITKGGERGGGEFGTPSDELLQKIYRADTLDDVNRVYLALERADDARRIMLEARALRQEHKLPNRRFVGVSTHFGPSYWIVEEELKRNEKPDETTPEYWKERAKDHRGRNEPTEEEAALRRALAFYNVADITKGGSHLAHLSAFRDLFDFLYRQERQDEALALFTEYRAAARHNIDDLCALYFHCATRDDADRFNAIEPALAEDLRTLHENPGRGPYSTISLLLGFLDVALRAGLLDPENDWAIQAVLPYSHSSYAHSSIRNDIAPVLFPKANAQNIGRIWAPNYPLCSEKQECDDAMLTALKAMTERKVLPCWLIVVVGEMMYKALNDENSNWFLLAALPQVTEKKKCLVLVIANYLAMGDWQNSEKYIALAEECGATPIDELRQAADLAEKDGAPDAAQRMRDKIKNLGTRP